MALRAIRSWAIVFCVLLCLLGTLTTPAIGEELSQGSSSRKQRQEVTEQIPYAQLNQDTQRKISAVLDKPSMYRSLPRMALQIDPDYLKFLIRHPEVVVNIWEMMGITEMKAERVGPYTLKTDDGAGTTSDMELVYGSGDVHIFYGDGQYEGPVLRKKLHAQCVIVVRTSPRKNPPADALNGNPTIIPNDRQMICQLDVFLRIKNPTAGLIVRTIQPIVGPTADHNFVETMKFIQRLNETTEDNGYGVQAMGKKLTVHPNVQQKFIAVAGNVHQRALGRNAHSSPQGRQSEMGPFPNSAARPRSNETDRPVAIPTVASDIYGIKQSAFFDASPSRASSHLHSTNRSTLSRQHGYSRYPAASRNRVEHAFFSDQ